MKFKAGQRRKALEYEKDLVKYWKEHGTFEKSIAQRPADNAYVFYDGPPFITGVPHHGTLLSSIAKDVVPRYWTMKGRRVERVWGWDCHGLPAEVFTEKKLGIQDRRDIGTKISLEEYITTCRDNMVQTGNLWEDTIDRIGRWVDFKGAYKTMDKNFMESVWWAFKKLYDEGKIYQGEKVLLYCTRDATPLSKAEVTMDAGAYQDVTDPSVYVKFKLKPGKFFLGAQEYKGNPPKDKLSNETVEITDNTYLLAWTTQPWTLPANSAVALHKDVTYVEVQVEGEIGTFIVAKELADRALQDEKHHTLPYKIIRELKGQKLIGCSYEPLFTPEPTLQVPNAFKVWHADFVHLEEGTGIVHESPATGEEDYNLAKENNIPWIMTTDESGIFTMSEWKGLNLWDANKVIAKALHQRGVVWRIDYIVHSYPHCYRCGTKLMYRAHPSWFLDIDGQRQLMLEQNENVSWFPEHLKHGRFQKTVETAPDWNLSRDRFWATAMPIWEGTDKVGKLVRKVVGSYAELKELSGVELEDYHRPWVDDIEFDLDGVHFKRIDKVLDCWFESGSMSFAQFHYPFENVEKFEASFPGDYIVEYVGQVRAWFYYMHAVSVALFGKNSFKQVVTTGTLSGDDGRKMSKSYGNYTDPNELMDLYSADALRFLLMSSTLMSGEDFALQDKDVANVQRKLAMVWNMYDFFTTYAEVDEWESPAVVEDPSKELSNPLDIWVVSRLHQLTEHLTTQMDNYDLPYAMSEILPFLDDASNWFVRRSRRRFWKSEDDSDKENAYKTLYYVLHQLSLLLAPFTPFLADELYQKLTGGESVHLLDWPKVGAIDQKVLDDMALVREVINSGLSQRASCKLKVRQPLASVTINASNLNDEYVEIIREELNVKDVLYREETKSMVDHAASAVPNDLSVRVADTITAQDVLIDTEITPELKREGLMREVVRNVQQARKNAGLQVDDRITLSLVTDDQELQTAITEHAETIKAETLAVSLADTTAASDGKPDQHASEAKVEGAPLRISLQKV